jgi:hypothetical protein
MNDIDDDDIFYDAKESLSKDVSPVGKSKSRLSNIRDSQNNSIKRQASVYEDVTDAIENNFSEFILENNVKEEIDNLKPFNKVSENYENIESMENLKTMSTKSFHNESMERKEREQDKLRKLELMNEELKEISLDTEFLKKNLKTILVKNKGIKEKHLQNLFELQNFQGDSQQIWTARFSSDGRYLATGGKSGVLKIWEIYTEEESLDNYEFKGILSYIKLVNESAFKIYTEHTQDIIDICWNPKVKIFRIF